MSEQPVPAAPAVNRNLIAARLKGLKLSRAQGVVGPAELIALVVSFVMLVLVIIAYFYFQIPARSRLERLELERVRLEKQLVSSQSVAHQGQTTEATVQTITQSIDAFENRQLLNAAQGRMSLYASLNDLIRKNGLRNTSGPTYTPLDPIGKKTATGGTKSVSAKWQTIYPGLTISLTVDGPYQNLRRFVRDLEANRQLVIINGVELERATETESGPSADGAPASAQGSLVSLRLEMATYFRRASEVAPVE